MVHNIEIENSLIYNKYAFHISLLSFITSISFIKIEIIPSDLMH